MPRTKIISDEAVFHVILRILSEGGEKGVSFSTVSRATGLAAPTLVQRFGTRDAMVQKSLQAAWARLITATETCIAGASDKGAQGLMKSLDALCAEGAYLSVLLRNLHDPALHDQATHWRAAVQTAIAARLGTGEKASDAAAMVFFAWQGSLWWQPTGDAGIRPKDILKRLG